MDTQKKQIGDTIELIKVQGLEKYLLRIEHRVFYISEGLCIIIEELMNNQDAANIAVILNNRCNLRSELFTGDIIKKVIDQKLNSLDLFNSENRNNEQRGTNYIKHRFILLTYPAMKEFLKIIRPLFNPLVFWVLLVTTLVLSIVHLTIAYSKGMFLNPSDSSLSTSLISLACFLIIIFFHELGHAGATYYNKLIPKEIGVGLYLLFPVMYTDVTNIWSLTRQNRIIINLAGLYFQLIINTALVIISCFISNSIASSVIRTIITSNMFSIIYNINPFFRCDGYWIYSDLFNLPNLKKKTREYTIQLFYFLWSCITYPLNKRITSFDMKLPLLVYSICYYTFIFYITFCLAGFVPVYFRDTKLLIKAGIGRDDAIKIIRYIIIAFLMVYTLIKTMVRIYKLLLQKLKSTKNYENI